jgi:hypothetical protein
MKKLIVFAVFTTVMFSIAVSACSQTVKNES